MATKKRMPQVKCPYCGKYFYRDVEEFVQINKTRYAHKACYDRHNAELTQEERDLNILKDFIKKLFNIDSITEKINRQIKNL